MDVSPNVTQKFEDVEVDSGETDKNIRRTNRGSCNCVVGNRLCVNVGSDWSMTALSSDYR